MIQDAPPIYGILSSYVKHTHCKERGSLRLGRKVEEKNTPLKETENRELRDGEGKQRKCWHEIFAFFFKSARVVNRLNDDERPIKMTILKCFLDLVT